MFAQSISEHKPLVEKLNKTGEALIRLCNDEEGSKVQEILDTDNARYSALRVELRQRQQALEKALQVRISLEYAKCYMNFLIIIHVHTAKMG